MISFDSLIFVWVFVKQIIILEIVETQSNLMWVLKKKERLDYFGLKMHI